MTEEPRQFVRWLDCRCLMQRSSFSPVSPPQAEELLLARDRADLAEKKYGNQFPYILHGVARTAFFSGDIQRAIDLTELGLKRCPQNTGAFASNLLNEAVLQLFATNWIRAFTGFVRAISHPGFRMFDFAQLIEFADVARDFRYESAVFLQVLYRNAGKIDVSVELNNEYKTWVEDDPSREPLRLLLNHFILNGFDQFARKIEALKTQVNRNASPADRQAVNKVKPMNTGKKPQKKASRTKKKSSQR